MNELEREKERSQIGLERKTERRPNELELKKQTDRVNELERDK